MAFWQQRQLAVALEQGRGNVGNVKIPGTAALAQQVVDVVSRLAKILFDQLAVFDEQDGQPGQESSQKNALLCAPLHGQAGKRYHRHRRKAGQNGDGKIQRRHGRQTAHGDARDIIIKGQLGNLPRADDLGQQKRSRHRRRRSPKNHKQKIHKTPPAHILPKGKKSYSPKGTK